MAQVVEHVLGKDEVTGSNPVSSSKRKSVLERERIFVCIIHIYFDKIEFIGVIRVILSEAKNLYQRELFTQQRFFVAMLLRMTCFLIATQF